MRDRRAVSVNDRGHVIGEDHHSAKLTDHEVWLIHELIADGMRLREIAEKFEISIDTAKAISCGRKRGQVPVAQRLIASRPARYRPRPASPDEFDVVGEVYRDA